MIPSYGPPGPLAPQMVSPRNDAAKPMVATPAAPDLAHSTHAMLSNLRLANITPNPNQPRKQFDEQGLAGLAESIKANGLIQPILVRRVPGPEAGPDARFQLVAGERRFRAAKIAGLAVVPAIIKSVQDDAMLELALVENIQRTDLNPMERANAYTALVKRGLQQDVVAQRLGESRVTITNYMRLLDLPEEVQAMISDGQLTFGHAKALLALRKPVHQLRMAKIIVTDKWSVRDVEKLMSRIPEGDDEPNAVEELLDAVEGAAIRDRTRIKAPAPAQPAKPANIVSLEEKLTRRLGTRVTIRQSRRPNIGLVMIPYYDLNDFDRILDALDIPRD